MRQRLDHSLTLPCCLAYPCMHKTSAGNSITAVRPQLEHYVRYKFLGDQQQRLNHSCGFVGVTS